MCDSFCVSAIPHLANDLEVCVTNCMDNPRSCFCESGRDACFEIVLYASCRPCFSGILQQLCPFPFFGLHANIVGKYVFVERIVARSVLVSRVLHVFSIGFVCLPFFSNPCLQGWATICSFVYMGARDSCPSSLSYVAVSTLA